MKKGEVYWIELKEDGSVQGKCRPCIILRKNGSVCTVIPLTTKFKRMDLLSHCEVSYVDLYGRVSVSNCLMEQLTTVDLKHFKRPCGVVEEKSMEIINDRLKLLLCS